MKLMLQLLAFMLLLGVIYITIINGGNTITLYIMPPSGGVDAEVAYEGARTVSIAFFALSVLGAGLISGLCLFVPFYLTQTEQLFAYKRELEKSSILTDNSSAQVKVLQAKIQVLEKALKEALR
ncbi:hypothetical protein IKP85_03255 [bacterium]|nr:hypothetical protein [bacterium]